MKKVFLVILLTSSLFSQDVFNKDFWKQDKQKHFVGSALIAGTTTTLARHYVSNKLEAFFIGFGSALAIGVLKEYSDGKNTPKHSEDINDIYADLGGTVIGSVLVISLEGKF